MGWGEERKRARREREREIQKDKNIFNFTEPQRSAVRQNTF